MVACTCFIASSKLLKLFTAIVPSAATPAVAVAVSVTPSCPAASLSAFSFEVAERLLSVSWPSSFPAVDMP